MKRRPNPVPAIVAIRTLQFCLPALALHWLVHWPLTGPHALGLFVTPLLCLYFLFVFIATWSWGLPISTRLRTSRRQVALTFDDGPSVQTTPLILDILRDHQVHATFFVLGEASERHPDLLKRIVQEGHSIGLHGYGHRAVVLDSGGNVIQEIANALGAVCAVCPEISVPVWFRPPYGFKTLSLPWLVWRAGCRMMTWSLDSRDYSGLSATLLVQRVLARLHPGAIILLHDGPLCHPTVAALPVLLERLAATGYECIVLDPPFSKTSLRSHPH